VYEAEFYMMLRVGASGVYMLVTQGNLASTYAELGRHEEALSMRRDVYYGLLKLKGEEHGETLREANNYVSTFMQLKRRTEAKRLAQKTLLVARRVLGESHELTLTMRMNYAMTILDDEGAKLDDIREAVTTVEDTELIARRVFGGAHPFVRKIEADLRNARAVLRARETQRS